jgi:hypothetical protein
VDEVSGIDQDIAETLVIALSMKMRKVFSKGTA